MDKFEAQQTLDRLLAELRSGDPSRGLAAIRELNNLTFSSRAIVRELERLALTGEGQVPLAALLALSLPASLNVAAESTRVARADRRWILQEIEKWANDDLIQGSQAEVLKRRYDFDLRKSPPISPFPAPLQPPAVNEQAASPEPAQPEIQAPASEPRTMVPKGPRPSLMQTLLSEASIKLYLYLGAFFVIASAIILAALVEAARLPILAAATLAFGAGAFILRVRLPQPSFALFIVFSFLLPIGANVLGANLEIRGPGQSLYWSIVLLGMAVIWALGTWLYDSRLFSVVAFVSFSLALYEAAGIFDPPVELNTFLMLLGSLFGLAGVELLRRWKDSGFAAALFWTIQAQTGLLLLVSLITASLRTFESDPASTLWLLVGITWIVAVVFYILSDRMLPGVPFIYAAVVALLPLPWFFLSAVGASDLMYAFGFAGWAMMLAIGSEAAFRVPHGRIQRAHWPLLIGSVPMFLGAISSALVLASPYIFVGVFAIMALAYGALHLLRARWYVWSAALLSGLAAYIFLFTLPRVEPLGVPFVFQLLSASVLLVTPELFARSPLSDASASRWPALLLGVFVALSGMLLALTEVGQPGRGLIVWLVYAVLFSLHAIHSRQTWLVYPAVTAAVLTIVHWLWYLSLDLWLPALTGFSILLYAAGATLRRRGGFADWSRPFANSALALGMILTISALADSDAAGGWYLLAIAAVFAVDTLARPLPQLELVVESTLSIAMYLILRAFDVPLFSHLLFGISIIWIGGDLAFARLTRVPRPHAALTVVTGYVLVFLSTSVLLEESSAAPSTGPRLNDVFPVLYFLYYAGHFALDAIIAARPRFGFFSTGFFALALFKISSAVGIEKSLFPLIALAVVYYLAGYILRRVSGAGSWEQVLRNSGLMLGLLTALGAPLQGGLDSSIPVAIAATLFAVEAVTLRSVWRALPANMLYLMSYLIILIELRVDQPQYYSIGTALIGMLMHYLLTRAGSKSGAFLAGLLSQFVLLGTTYYQMVSTSDLSYFFVLFIQSMVILAYGIVMRSRSLVLASTGFAVLGVATVLYSALRGLSLVILIGVTGITLLVLGILAVIMRERITTLAERFGDWNS